MASPLESIRDQLKAQITSMTDLKSQADQQIVTHQAVLAVVEAEIARVPTLDDVRSVLDKIAVQTAHT